MRFSRYLADPVDGSAVREIDTRGAVISFESGRRYPLTDGIPILVPPASSFDVEDIQAGRPTTQDREYRRGADLKNRVRRDLLPELTVDRGLETRYRLASAESKGTAALVVGAGDKVDQYRGWLRDNDVITSDVHLQFGPDLVLDAHWLPFRDASLGLVVAAQVLEHTVSPWLVAAQIERVLVPGGLVQVEVPFAFPLHGAPWDFYRFTLGGLRALFRHSALVRAEVAEGGFSATAVLAASAVTSCFTGRRARMAAVLAGRLGLAWMKYLDPVITRAGNDLSAPKGLAATFSFDGRPRSDAELVAETRSLTLERP